MTSRGEPEKRSRVTSGSETVRNELEVMNQRYMDLYAQSLHRLKMLKELHDRDRLFFPVSFLCIFVLLITQYSNTFWSEAELRI